jgi:hypothetical protein
LLYLADQIAGRTVFGRMTDRVPVNLLAGWTTALPVTMAVAVRAHNLAATSALVATGLCHAVAPAQDSSAGGGTAGPITALAERIGELTVIEIARTGSTNAVLVVPALASYTQPVAALRAVLRSTAFQRRLLGYRGYSTHSTGRKTWHGADAQRTEWQGVSQVSFGRQ